MKGIYRALFVLHIFVGIGALFGGSAAIIYPKAPLGMPLDPLKNTPFDDYLIPGIILFTVIGLGNIISAFTLRAKSKFQGYISSVFSWALVIWIVVQCVMLRAVAFLHVLYFIVGLLGAGLSIVLLFEQRLFPANIALNLYKSIKGKNISE